MKKVSRRKRGVALPIRLRIQSNAAPPNYERTIHASLLKPEKAKIPKGK